MLATAAEVHFSTLDALMPKISEAVLSLRGLRAATSSKLAGFTSPVSAQIADRLAALGFTSPTLSTADDAVEQAANGWLNRARELVKDGAATR